MGAISWALYLEHTILRPIVNKLIIDPHIQRLGPAKSMPVLIDPPVDKPNNITV